MHGAFGLIWDYFCWYNISVFLLLETKARDVSGPELTKIFLDLIHATTCSHLIISSAILSSKHVSIMDYSPISAVNIHLGVKRLGRRNCVRPMKENVHRQAGALYSPGGWMAGLFLSWRRYLPYLSGGGQDAWGKKAPGAVSAPLCGMPAPASCLVWGILTHQG